jgi:hypothetical protein
MKKAIYSVIIGDYDHLHPAPKQDGWDCYLYTDQNFTDSMGWCVIPVPVSKNPKLDSRRYKILSHNYLKDYDLVCYIDANYTVIGELPYYPMRFLHGQRNSVYDECDQVLKLRKETRGNIDYLKEYMDTINFPLSPPPFLFQNGFFVRFHDPISNQLHDYWFWLTQLITCRDQLTLPVAMHKVPFTDLYPLENYQHKRYFKKLSNHK